MNGYPFVINLYAMLLSGAVFIGLAFALLLWLIKGPEQKANFFMGLALIVLCTCLLPLGPFQSPLALGPLLYFYVRRLTESDRQIRYKDLHHFVPALIAFILAIAGLNINPALAAVLALFMFTCPIERSSGSTIAKNFRKVIASVRI